MHRFLQAVSADDVAARVLLNVEALEQAAAATAGTIRVESCFEHVGDVLEPIVFSRVGRDPGSPPLAPNRILLVLPPAPP